jgi:NitT/TauT family transport system substrate-binding protein
MHRSVPWRVRAAAVLALVAPLALAGCGGSSDGGSSTGSGGTTKVTVGVIPIVDVAPLYLGVKKGFFSDEGLDVDLQTAQGGAAIVPAVMSGQYQFGFSNATSLLLGASKGLDLRVVAAGNATTGAEGKDFGAVIVKGDSPIRSAADLAGKKVAVNTLNNINTTTVNEAVRKAGGDPSGIQYVELPFPDIVSAVAKGDVDAGQVVEPFLTQALDSGDRQVSSNYAATDPNLMIGLYFTSGTYADKNAALVKSFTAAMDKSLQYADSHPDEARQIVSTYTDIDEATLAKITLPKWPTAIPTDAVQKLADLAVQDGLMEKAPDLSSLLPSGS